MKEAADCLFGAVAGWDDRQENTLHCDLGATPPAAGCGNWLGGGWLGVASMLSRLNLVGWFVGAIARLTRTVLLLLLAALAPAVAHAQVQYVQVCGAGSIYVPGTTTCVNANQISATQLGIAQAASTEFTGIAMSSALVEPFVPDNANFAISIHEAMFEDKLALGVTGMMRLKSNLMLSAGLAMGMDSGSVELSERTQTAAGTSIPGESWTNTDWLGRIGLTYAW